MHRLALALLLLLTPAIAADKKTSDSKKKNKGEDKKASALPYEVAEFIEPDFPFFSSTLDCSDVGEGFQKDNITPRGLILNLGHNLWACFDIDLLRIACIWESEPGKPPITLNALAPRSYKDPGQKTKDGEEDIPKPLGKVLLANGLYPGMQMGDKPSFVDPRQAGADAKEVGRGPVSPDHMAFESVSPRLGSGERGVTLKYRIGTAQIADHCIIIPWQGKLILSRELRVGAHDQPVTLVLGKFAEDTETTKVSQNIGPSLEATYKNEVIVHDGIETLTLAPETIEISLSIQHSLPTASRSPGKAKEAGSKQSKAVDWKLVLPTKTTIESSKDTAFVLDTIGIPSINPWKRNVRLADIAFLDDQGHAAAVTMDGDVWMISGLKGNLERVEWKRFTSGLHEPMSIEARPRSMSVSASFGSGASTDRIATPGREESRRSVDREKVMMGVKAHVQLADQLRYEIAAYNTPSRNDVNVFAKQIVDKAAKLNSVIGLWMNSHWCGNDGRWSLEEFKQQSAKEIAKLKQQGASAALIKTTEDKYKATVSEIEEFVRKDELTRDHMLADCDTLIGELDQLEQKRYVALAKVEPYELFVFDRNGIWKLLDTNNDGECDVHEMFCNLFTQTAETREFPNSMKLGPKGELYISKGGQQGTSLGKDNGTVLRIAPDGKSYETVGWGLRQPFIGVNEKTGLVTASDQQGNYVPSTPLHIIRDHQFYGHLATIQPQEQYPASIADPLTWIPHPVNPSSVTQVWLNDAKMGPLNGECIHVAYSRPDIFRVMFDKRQKDHPQAAVAQIPLPFTSPMLNGHVNPADGCLYMIGFQIWGTTAKEISGLTRVRYTGAESTLPCEVSAMDKGILVRFDCAVDKTTAANPDNYAVERWNYKRTWDYGSAHYKLDGNTGQELMTASAAYVSEDGHSVFVAVPGLKKCDQMHLGWMIKSASGKEMNHNAYFTPWNFAAFDSGAEGFGKIDVNLTPRAAKPVAQVKPSVDEGKRLYQFVGCMGCHSVDGSVAGRLGPSWKGLFGSTRLLSDDTKVVADEAYIRESILEPSKKKAKAYLKLETGMPIYAGILNDAQIESIILYMKTLAE